MKRCALVTGANRGIGREVAVQLAATGLRVVVAGRDRAGCEEVVSEITRSGGSATSAILDVGEQANVEKFLTSLNEDIDTLVNNAGIFPDPEVGIFESDAASVREAMEVHLHAPLQLSRKLVASMQARGFGRVVNLTSGYALLSGMQNNLTAYRTSKAALNALTCILAAAVEGDIKVNAVDPGWVRTDMGGKKAPRSVREAAADVVWAATLGEHGPNGRLLRYREVIDW